MPYPTTARGLRCCFFNLTWRSRGQISSVLLQLLLFALSNTKFERREMICYVLAMGKQHLGPHVVVGYGIKIFWPGLFITSPDHLVMLACRHDADMLTWGRIVLSLSKCPHHGLELAYFAGKISKNRLVCKNVVALAYYGSCRLLVMGSWNHHDFL